MYSVYFFGLWLAQALVLQPHMVYTRPVSEGTGLAPNTIGLSWRLNTRTPYDHRTIRPTLAHGPPQSHPVGFTLLKLEQITRHGSRFPKEANITKMNRALADITKAFFKGKNPPSDFSSEMQRRFDWILTGPPVIHYSTPYELNQVGRNEMKQQGVRLAHRYQAAIQDYLKVQSNQPKENWLPYSSLNPVVPIWQFSDSGASRTENSMASFRRGLLEGTPPRSTGGVAAVTAAVEALNSTSLDDLADQLNAWEFDGASTDSSPVWSERGIDPTDQADFDIEVDGTTLSEDERLLKPYIICPAWKALVKGPEGMRWIEQRAKVTRDRLKQRFDPYFKELGLPQWAFHKHLVPLYDICSFQWGEHASGKTAQRAPPKSCRVFTNVDLLELEYLDDIQNYAFYSHARSNRSSEPHVLNHVMAWPLLDNIFTTMRKVIAAYNSGIATADLPYLGAYPLGNFYFAHARIIFFMLALLELERDPIFESTTADVSASQIQQRSFTSSTIVPMGANIAFELWVKDGTQDFYVRVRHNEQVVVPGYGACSVATGLCAFEQLVAEVKSLHGGDFKETCHTS
ncbi:hypothetical protein H4R33_002773 [Dimargaris cristalligena]|nr:hypothetical protein H4R33_002773 [Dimargaris cristalligena]